jgi:hypothetical protein
MNLYCNDLQCFAFTLSWFGHVLLSSQSPEGTNVRKILKWQASRGAINNFDANNFPNVVIVSSGD